MRNLDPKHFHREILAKLRESNPRLPENPMMLLDKYTATIYVDDDIYQFEWDEIRMEAEGIVLVGLRQSRSGV